ncbi:adenylate cyclase type 9 [Plakobranchus ocellatus]|uniref:adenylate cyclase n=1 Tax=Plakobranchus ocellatus TaxID=259542 RepID=A0AAV4DTX7_9GAST|nr:adenylate cyclase type 9 [Plakobranchus ocellatus]
MEATTVSVHVIFSTHIYRSWLGLGVCVKPVHKKVISGFLPFVRQGCRWRDSNPRPKNPRRCHSGPAIHCATNAPYNRGKKELIEHYDAAQSSFTIKHREETRNIKTYFITGRKPGKTGIPGLMETADRRPKQFQKKSTTGGNPSTEPENGNSASATAELFAPPIPDPMSEDNDLDAKGEEEAEQGVDSTLLKQQGMPEAGGARGSMTTAQDIELIEILKKKEMANKELFQPKLNKLSLTFDPEQEHMYRHEYINSHLFQENMLSSPRYQTLIESNLALTAMIVLVICCHIMVGGARTTALTIITIVGITFEVLVVIDALTNILCLEAKKTRFPTWMRITMNWYFRNILGIVMATIPTALVLSSLSCDLVVSDLWRDRFFCFAIVVALLHYCNHTMLRSFAKTVVAVCAGTVFIVLLFIELCSLDSDSTSASSSGVLNYTTLSGNVTGQNSSSSTLAPPVGDADDDSYNQDHLFTGKHLLRFEIILSVLLLFVLITLLNYEFENSYRLSFYASVKAQRDKENMQLNKDQAEWLLHNIIPAHLAELFKNNQGYSRNHQDVGVIFATIVNFNEFYDEMYAGGREYLRVLNELVSDYEVMLSETRFKDVEKIKTISSSFMAAAGLNEESRAMNKHKHAHLFALMEFAMELQQVVERFNDSIFNFSFVLNIGYNFGPVTAGVIGTTKLLYDIWGDTVNIASRMYSTGEADRIQVPQAAAEALSEMFEFSYRDEIAVKGKGMMKTYLLEKKKDGAHWE